MGITTAEAAFAVDCTQRIVGWNEGAQRLTGYDSAEMVNKLCYRALGFVTCLGDPICSEECGLLNAAVAGCLSRGQDVLVRGKGDRELCIRLTTAIAGTGAKHIIHFMEDVTLKYELQALAEEILSHFQNNLDPPGPNPGLSSLTNREIQVMEMLSHGLAIDRVAEMLNVAPATARNHVQHAIAKLGAHSRLEAVLIFSHAFKRWKPKLLSRPVSL